MKFVTHVLDFHHKCLQEENVYVPFALLPFGGVTKDIFIMKLNARKKVLLQLGANTSRIENHMQLILRYYSFIVVHMELVGLGPDAT